MDDPKKATWQHLIGLLAERYPKAFSLDPRSVRPLKPDILSDIIADTGDESLRRPIGRALAYYIHWPSYLHALAMGKKLRDLHGARVASATQPERERARRELLALGQWSEAAEAVFVDRLPKVE